MSSSPLLENPFTVGRMVLKAENFVGRSREIHTLLSRLKTRNSISLTGARRIGKSSLLYHLFLTGTQRMGSHPAYRFIYLSFHAPEMKTQAGFVRCVLEELAWEGNEEALAEKPLILLSRVLKERKREGGEMPILLLDEFERITESKELFQDDFFEALRTFANDGRIAYVTASLSTLRELTEKGQLTSPFWNIFTHTPLREYQLTDRVDEPTAFLNHFWGADRLDGTAKEWKWLFSFKSTHPLAMQAFSYWLFENRTLGYDYPQLLTCVENDLHAFFRDDKEKITKWLKERRQKMAKTLNDTTAFIGENVKNLSPLKGIGS